MKQILNAKGQLRGRIIECGNQKTLQDRTGRVLGWYNSNHDRTYNKHGSPVGPGDQLMSLFED